jgi:hypothetical protein
MSPSITVKLIIPEASESVAGASKLSYIRYVLANQMVDENFLVNRGGLNLQVVRDSQGIALRASRWSYAVMTLSFYFFQFFYFFLFFSIFPFLVFSIFSFFNFEK